MSLVNIHDAKTHFSQLIQRALDGKEVIIARAGKPLIKLTPYQVELSPRKGGQLKGVLKIADNFDAPLPKLLMNSFLGDDK